MQVLGETERALLCSSLQFLLYCTAQGQRSLTVKEETLHLLAISPLVNYFISSGLSFLIYEMAIEIFTIHS